MYIEKIPRENHHEASCFALHNAPSYYVTGKEARNWYKKGVFNWKIYEMALCKGESCNKSKLCSCVVETLQLAYTPKYVLETYK